MKNCIRCGKKASPTSDLCVDCGISRLQRQEKEESTRFDDSHLYVGVRAEGIPFIADGRIFLLSSMYHYPNGSLKPELEPGSIRYEGDACEMRTAGSDMPNKCPECGKALTWHLTQHTYEWMYALFVCVNHPKTVWMDVFPKESVDTGWDMINRWPTYLDSEKTVLDDPNREIMEKVVIANGETPMERYEQNRNRVPIKYILTLDGIRAIPKATNPAWYRELWHRFKSIFHLRAA